MKLQPVKVDVELAVQDWQVPLLDELRPPELSVKDLRAMVDRALHVDPVTEHRLMQERRGVLDRTASQLAQQALLRWGADVRTNRAIRPGQVVVTRELGAQFPTVYVHPSTDLKFWLDLAALNRRLDALELRLKGVCA